MLCQISNVPRDYPWGSTTLLAALESRKPSGRPEAEVWFGDHPGDPSDLTTGQTLDAITGGGMPYLLKILAADRPLSIQAHPSKVQAEAGFARESHLQLDSPERNYRDRNHKPELLVALRDGFEALAGLRPLNETNKILSRLPASDGVLKLQRLLSEPDPLRRAIEWALTTASSDEIERVSRSIMRLDSSKASANLRAVQRIAELHPNDSGIILALLMNHVVLRAGEALFIPPGTLHAYLQGVGVEVMAASDNVLRGGLTQKHTDPSELLKILDHNSEPVRVNRPVQAGSELTYATPVADFNLRSIKLTGTPIAVSLAAPCVILVTAGEVHLGDITASAGKAIFASENHDSIALTGYGQAFIAEPGDERQQFGGPLPPATGAIGGNSQGRGDGQALSDTQWLEA